MFITLNKAVHPRACGEHVETGGPGRGSRGSSPRLRGTLNPMTGRPYKNRFIPAPAGNTGSAARASPARPVHPRACGEHSGMAQDSSFSRGSSPRLRGTPDEPGKRTSGGRFIPAPAGNTCALQSCESAPTVHPRACGEHGLPHGLVIVQYGSSPRLRGTRQLAKSYGWRARFIPAPAGNTVLKIADTKFFSVHPRACGEHASVFGVRPSNPGSSPRLRGTPEDGPAQRDPLRFIPAPAGNTTRQPDGRRGIPVHPRACGEHSGCSATTTGSTGSSPRLRGTLRLRVSPLQHLRFIPAPAGNTRRLPLPRRTRPVHPRACGEHALYGYLLGLPSGSSPRLRGTPVNPQFERCLPGFIPAPAGNTAASCAPAWPPTVHPRACGEHVPVFIRALSVSGSSPRLRGTQRTGRGSG